MIIKEFLTRWGIEVDDKQLDEMNAKIGQTHKRLAQVAKSAVSTGTRLSAFVTLPLVGIAGALVKTASDAEETQSKFNVVFGNIQNDAETAAKNLRDNFGLSSNAAKQLLGDTGDLLTGFGFTQDSALQLSDQVNQLAVDLASFTNFSGGAEGASKALTKALLGERESVKSLGISILEEDVKKEVARLKTQGLTFATERQAKAQATLNLAMKQSKNAIGDFARTSGGFANQMRILQGELSDLAVEFGKELLPIALDIVKEFLRPAVKFFRDLSPEVKKIILITGGLVAALGPLLVVFGLVTQSILAMRTAYLVFSVAGKKAALAALLPFLKIIAIGALVGLVIEDIIGFFQGKDSVTGLIVEGFKEAFDYLEKKFTELPGFVRVIAAALLTPFRAVINSIKAVAGAAGALSQGDFGGALTAIKEGFLNTYNPDTSSLSGILGFKGNPSNESSIIPANAARAAQAVNSSTSATTTQNVNAPITVNVPQGTPATEVGPAVERGVQKSLESLLRQTQRQTKSAVVN